MISYLESIEGEVYLYKSGRPFLSAQLAPKELISFAVSPNLYFGLTKKKMNEGDVLEEKEKYFSPLAKLDRSYFTGGIKIDVSDNPAGRPHLTIEKID